MNTNTQATPATTVAIALGKALSAADSPSKDQDVAKEVVFVDNEATSDAEADAAEAVSTEESPFAGILDGFEDEDEDEGEAVGGQQDFGTVEIYSEKCVTCKSLVAFATKEYKKCHFTKGNTECPAQGLRITIRVPVEKIAAQFRGAKQSNDNARLARLYAKLAEFPDYYQQRVTEYLKAKNIA